MGICLRITDLEDNTAALGGAYNNLAFMECRLLPTVLGPWLGQGLDRVLLLLYRLLPSLVMYLGWSWWLSVYRWARARSQCFLICLSVRFAPNMSLPPLGASVR